MSRAKTVGPILATIEIDPGYIHDVIESAYVHPWGSLRRRYGLLCDACGRSINADEYATDDEVCKGSDGPGFYLCKRQECGSRIPNTTIKARAAIYERQRAKNEAKRTELCWYLYEREGKDPTEAYLINRPMIAHAIARMAVECPEQLGRLLAKTGDGDTASCLVQLAAFDEVRYG